MKKILVLSFFMVFILAGCGQQIDYTDPQSYVDYAEDSLNDVNSEIEGNVQELKDNLDLSGNSKALDQVEKYYDQILESLTLEQAEDLYNTYTDNVDDLVDDSTDKINDVNNKVEKYVKESADYSQEQIDKAQDEITTTFSGLDEQITKYEDMLKGLADNPEDLQRVIQGQLN